MHSLASLIRIVVQIELILIFIRVLISWFPGIPPWHPMVRLLSAFTSPVLRPFRRIMPSLGGIDFSPIVAIVVLQIVGNFVADLIDTGSTGAPVAYTIVNALQRVIDTVLIILVIIVALRIVVSLFKVSPFHPAARMIRDMSSPLVRPFTAVAGRNPAADIPAIVALVVYFVLWVVADRLLGDLARSLAGTPFS